MHCLASFGRSLHTITNALRRVPVGSRRLGRWQYDPIGRPAPLAVVCTVHALCPRNMFHPFHLFHLRFFISLVSPVQPDLVRVRSVLHVRIIQPNKSGCTMYDGQTACNRRNAGICTANVSVLRNENWKQLTHQADYHHCHAIRRGGYRERHTQTVARCDGRVLL